MNNTTLEAERAVLGSVLIQPASIYAAVEVAKADDFEAPNHRVIFQTMVDLAREKRPIDTVSLVSALHGAGAAHITPAEVVDLPLAVPTAANISHYARLVRSRSRLRRVSAIAKDIAIEALKATEADSFIAEAQGRLLALSEESPSRILSAEEWTRQALEDLERRAESDAAPALLTGLDCVDNASALRPGSEVLIAGRPSMGKTALAQDICLRVAERGHHGLFVSVEMAQRELVSRWIASRAEVNTRELDRPRWLDYDGWVRIRRALDGMSPLRLDLICPGELTASKLWALCRRTHALEPLQLVVIDYIQLLLGEGGRENREREVGDISRTCKLIAKDLGCVVVALSQLNRKVEDRSPPIPQNSDLRDSGSLEQDADVILFPYRPHFYNDTADPNECELYFGKNRNGPRGHGSLRFEPETQRFENAT